MKRQPIIPAIVRCITRAMTQAEILAESASERRVSELGVQLNAGLVKVSAKMTNDQSAPPRPPLTGSEQVDQLEGFFEESCRLITGRGGAGLLVVLDELHAPLETASDRDLSQEPQAVNDAGVLLNAVQNMEAQRERFPLGVVGAGLPSTKALLTRVATFGERTVEIVLPKLDDAASRLLLTKPATQLGVTWQPDALNKAVAIGDGYPQLLQLVGAATWDEAKPTKGGQITLTQLLASQATVRMGLNSMFSARWAVASSAERRFLHAMAAHSTEQVPRSAVARQLGVETRALSMARRSLIEKGVVEAAGHGKLRFTAPGFGQYVLSQSNGTPTDPPGGNL